MTLHSEYVKMSYGSRIKIKFLAPLLLGDFKNLLIPPRIYRLISPSLIVMLQGVELDCLVTRCLDCLVGFTKSFTAEREITV